MIILRSASLCTDVISKFWLNLQNAGSIEVVKGLLDTRGHGLLRLAHPDARVVLLLIGLIRALGVADLGPAMWVSLENSNNSTPLCDQVVEWWKERSRYVLEVLDVLGDVVTDTTEVGPLQVSVDVDLDNAVPDGLLELGEGRAGAAVENKEHGLIIVRAKLLLNVGLVLGEQLGVELDIAVHALVSNGAL